ncbi:MAG: hypothetical protein ACI9FB_002005 [Candidatus Azotimanducaceae bacterium]|jgi:hypothetical protein
MSVIELYDNEMEAIGAKDHYNHTLSKRVIVPVDPVQGYGGDPVDRMLRGDITSVCWLWSNGVSNSAAHVCIL